MAAEFQGRSSSDGKLNPNFLIFFFFFFKTVDLEEGKHDSRRLT